MAEDDALWPQTDRVGRQELEIVIGDKHRAETPTVTIIITSFITHLIVVGSALFLLSRPGSQVPGVLAHRTAFQDQPNLRIEALSQHHQDVESFKCFIFGGSVWIQSPYKVHVQLTNTINAMDYPDQDQAFLKVNN